MVCVPTLGETQALQERPQKDARQRKQKAPERSHPGHTNSGVHDGRRVLCPEVAQIAVSRKSKLPECPSTIGGDCGGANAELDCDLYLSFAL